MEIKMNLSHEQVEEVIVQFLKDQYQWLKTSPPIRLNEEELDLTEAYKLVLEDNMGYHAFQKYAHDLAKKNKKYNSKRLIEAEGGL